MKIFVLIVVVLSIIFPYRATARTPGFDISSTNLHSPFTPSTDQTQRLSPSDVRAGDQFGNAVSISGDTAVIGAKQAAVGQNQFQGAAYVYRRENGLWVFHQRIVWDAGFNSDEFGTSVAIRGDTIMVGVPRAYVSGNSFQGRVIVFRRFGSTWHHSQTLGAADGTQGDQFGQFISISGDTAMIGAHTDDIGPYANQGSVYVFAKTQNGWFEKQKLTAPDGAASDNFGNVSLSGETAVIGAFLASTGAEGSQGAAYVFAKNGGTWSFSQKLTATDGAPSDWFGSTVKIYGGTIVAGAYNADINTTFDNQGASYIFTKTGNTWIQRQKITVGDAVPARGFLVRSVNSNTIIASAARSTTGPGYNRGMAYVFKAGVGGIWNFEQRLEASDAANVDGFALEVEQFGNTILLGALFAEGTPGVAQGGAAYVFEEPIVPSLAVTIAGRVLARNGRGAFPARVSVEDAFGNIRYAQVNPSGYYRLKDLVFGSEYTLRVDNKRGVYNSRTVVPEAYLTAFDFAPTP